MPSRRSIDAFLSQQHVAVVGMSRDPKQFANAVATQLRQGGRTVYPVNPATDVLNGERCYHTVAEVPEPLDGVLVMVNAKAAKEVVEACVSRGVPRVWLHRGAGPGAVSDEAVTLCRDAGIDVVDGACPLMFAEPVARFHRVHRWFAKRRFAA
jgi:hypothetical protein